MALIKCPECGGNLSNTVKQCVHCGCKITVCSECATVIKGEVGTCPNCGYELKEKEERRVVHFEKLSDVNESWSAKSWLRKMYTGSSNIPIVMEIIGFLLIFIVAIRVICWKMGLNDMSNLFELVAKTEELLNSVKIMYVFFGLFVVGYSFLYDFRPYYYAYDFGKWAKRNDLDSTQLLRNYMGQNFNKMTVQEIVRESTVASNVLFTLVFQEDLRFQSREKRNIVVSTCLNAFKMILLCVFLVRMTDDYMEFILKGGDSYITGSLFEFENENFLLQNMLLILGIIIVWIIASVYESKMIRKRGNRCDAWIKEKMPSHYEKYDKYIKNLSDFVVNTAEAKKK